MYVYTNFNLSKSLPGWLYLLPSSDQAANLEKHTVIWGGRAGGKDHSELVELSWVNWELSGSRQDWRLEVSRDPSNLVPMIEQYWLGDVMWCDDAGIRPSERQTKGLDEKKRESVRRPWPQLLKMDILKIRGKCQYVKWIIVIIFQKKNYAQFSSTLKLIRLNFKYIYSPRLQLMGLALN